MAYQNVGLPKFYTDTITWLTASGIVSGIGGDTAGKMSFNGVQQWGTGTNIFSNPSQKNIITFSQLPEHIGTSAEFHVNTKSQPVNFIFLLGTNYTLNEFVAPLYAYQNTGASNWTVINVDPGITGGVNFGTATPFANDYRGWSFIEFPEIPPLSVILSIYIQEGMPDLQLNSIVVGKSYTMPHSPDLKLTMSREMDGVKRIRTKGGADLVNHKYTKPAPWGNAGAWELYEGTPNHALSRSGRRVWDLSFSYLSDSSVFPDNSSLTNYEITGYVEGDPIYLNTLLDGDDFYSQVIHKTNGGQLPFIFQPDSNDNNPGSGFAICKFDMKEFKFEQVANGVYNVKLKIREVW